MAECLCANHRLSVSFWVMKAKDAVMFSHARRVSVQGTLWGQAACSCMEACSLHPVNSYIVCPTPNDLEFVEPRVVTLGSRDRNGPTICADPLVAMVSIESQRTRKTGSHEFDEAVLSRGEWIDDFWQPEALLPISSSAVDVYNKSIDRLQPESKTKAWSSYSGQEAGRGGGQGNKHQCTSS